MGIALGTAMSGLFGVLFWGVLGAWAWLGPPVLTAVGAVALRTASRDWFRRPQAQKTRSRGPRASSVAIVVGIALGGLSLIANLSKYPLEWSKSVSTYHPDMLFFEALSTSLARFGPNDSIFMAGADLRYHWLVYAWSGQIAETAGTEPFVILTRVLPVTAMIGAILLAIGWSQRLTRSVWAPTLAVALIISGGYVGATYGTILNFDSPSQQLGTVWLLGLSLALWQTVQRQQSPDHSPALTSISLMVAAGALAAAASLGKVSSGSVAIAAWGFVALVASLRREPWALRAWIGLVVSALASLWVYFDFIAGSAEGGGLGIGSLLNKASSVQGLNPTDYWWGILAGTGLLVLAMSARWFGVVWLVADPSSRWKPQTVYGVGLIIISVATVTLMSGGLNETWFALAASAPLAVLSAAGLGRALESTKLTIGWRPSKAAVITTLGAVITLSAVVALWASPTVGGVSLRWLAPLLGFAGAALVGVFASRMPGLRRNLAARFLAALTLGLVVMAAGSRVLGIGANEFGVQPDAGLRPTEFRPVTPFLQAQDLTTLTAWTQSQQEAGIWLLENSEHSELVVTNITYSTLVAALSGRQTLISGISHQAPYGRKAFLPDILEREKDSINFINSPALDSYAPLCAFDVTWVWVDRLRTPTTNWEPFATVVFENSDTLLLKTHQSQC